MIKKIFLLVAAVVLTGCDNIVTLDAHKRRMILSQYPKIQDIFENPADSYGYIVRETNGTIWYYKYSGNGTNFNSYIIFRAQ